MNDSTSDVDSRDRMLLQRMAAGDRAALETLYRAYHGGLCRFLSRLTRRADLIEEIVKVACRARRIRSGFQKDRERVRSHGEAARRRRYLCEPASMATRSSSTCHPPWLQSNPASPYR